MLEAFGNAKTNKNDNSSRFGKFIKLQFNEGGVIIGTTISTYLLEKYRVVGQGIGERNFHIFYQLLSGIDKETRERYFLQDASEYNFLKGGQCLTVPSINDEREFLKTTEAMDIIGITESEQDCIFRVLSAIINLGNVEFETQFGTDGCDVKNPEGFLSNAAKLLNVDFQKLRIAIIKPIITAGNDKVQKNFTAEQSLVINKFSFSFWFLKFLKSTL